MVIKVEGDIIVAGDTNLSTFHGSRGYTQIEQKHTPFTSSFEFAPLSFQPEPIPDATPVRPRDYGFIPFSVDMGYNPERACRIQNRLANVPIAPGIDPEKLTAALSNPYPDFVATGTIREIEELSAELKAAQEKLLTPH